MNDYVRIVIYEILSKDILTEEDVRGLTIIVTTLP